MKEKNRNTLEKAIRRLPEYQPADAVWTGIATTLEEEAQAARLQAAIQDLPAYNPPNRLWEQIEGALDQPATRMHHFNWRRIAVAAALAGLALTIGWISLTAPRDQARVTYSQEELPPHLFQPDWDEDEPAFTQVMEFVARQQQLRQDPDFHNLATEMEELEQAKTELKQMLDRYGADPEIIRMMGKIERERSDVLQKLVAL